MRTDIQVLETYREYRIVLMEQQTNEQQESIGDWC